MRTLYPFGSIDYIYSDWSFFWICRLLSWDGDPFQKYTLDHDFIFLSVREHFKSPLSWSICSKIYLATSKRSLLSMGFCESLRSCTYKRSGIFCMCGVFKCSPIFLFTFLAITLCFYIGRPPSRQAKKEMFFSLKRPPEKTMYAHAQIRTFFFYIQLLPHWTNIHEWIDIHSPLNFLLWCLGWSLGYHCFADFFYHLARLIRFFLTVAVVSFPGNFFCL